MRHAMTGSGWRPTQAGATTVTLMAIMMLCLAVMVAYANRSALLDLAASANDIRAAQAFELAEAGAAWSAAHANLPLQLDAACRPIAFPAAPRGAPVQDFLGRLGLRPDPATAASRGSTGPPGRASCSAAAVPGGATEWHCRCPAGAPAATSGAAPGFTVELTQGSTPDVIELASTGCNAPAPTCLEARRSEGVATIRQTLRRLPLFDVDRLLAHMPVDGGTPATITFEALFGMTREAFASLPTVATLPCTGDCGQRIDEHWRAGYQVLRVAGDLSVQHPMALGSPERPIALIVDGMLRVDASLTVFGLLHVGGSPPMSITAAAVIQGAAGSSIPGTAASAELRPDPALLRQLAGSTGPYLPEPGSWHEP